MKKLLLSLISLLFAFNAIAQTFDYEGLRYTVTSPSEVSVGRIYGVPKTGSVTIPATVINEGTTYTVTSIRDTAFKYNSVLTSISIPNSITSIGEQAFVSCNSLTTVTFEENSNLNAISSKAFENCTGLTSIRIPNSITSIGDYAFLNCENLESISFEENSNLNAIPCGAFQDCTKLSSIAIPKNVTSLGMFAFMNCDFLATVTFEENSELTTISTKAFYGCDRLTSIIIPKKVETVNNFAFGICSSLTSVTFLAETAPSLSDVQDVFSPTPTKTLTVPFGSDYSAWETHTSWGEVNYKINAGETKTLNNDFLITDGNKRKVINEGVMVIGHDGQLINATTTNIGGVIEVQTPELAGNQWHFVGAPFNNYELEAIKPPATAQDVAVVLYDYSSGVWNNTFATIADPVSAGEGFFAWPFATEPIVFKSTKDNGTNAYTLNNTPEIAVNKTLISNPNNDSWMALANPYTFKLNIATFLDDQPENTIQGGVSYRFNGTSWTIANEGEINVTEGFFVNFASAGSSTVTFKKTQRNAPSAKVSEAREFIRLSMADGESNIELLFAHNEYAEQGYDIYDANKMFATTGVSEPYFVTEGIALVKEEVKELPYYATMNVRSSESKEVKFKADYIPEGLAVSIIDGEEVIDMVEGGVYSTEILTGENADRFKVLVKKNVGLADVEELDVRIVNSNRHIAITAQENVKVSVYNTLGQKVFETEETNFVLSGVASGAYVVKVQGDKAAKSQKIIVE